MITIRDCTLDDITVLQQLSIKTYYDTFVKDSTTESMEVYLESAYNYQKLHNELSNEHSFFYFLYIDDTLAGYLKLNEFQAQSDIYDEQSIELERIYVRREFQGQGLGQCLMNKTIEVATQLKKTYVWLGVWTINYKALDFYKKNGFYVFGEHSFFMGDDEQTDYIMKKDLIL